MTHINTNT